MAVSVRTSTKNSDTETKTAPEANRVPPGILFPGSTSQVVYRQHFTPRSSHLQFLTAGVFELSPSVSSREFRFPGEEGLLFMWHGSVTVRVGEKAFVLSPYDTLYVPSTASFRLENPSAERADVVHCSAPASKEHPAFHSRFADFSKKEERIRRLKGRDVFMMFDVTESAEKLVAGYTFFQPHHRSWPPHNHTDQEEVYFFLKGRGSMEVYESEEHMSFVKEVREGDMVTIPMLNYHPVFTQDSPLDFIWCIAGERYWVGDKNKAFMTGSGGPITT
jgi:mannose-6-phosphate isomerase-like protein (cupin superfamily)